MKYLYIIDHNIAEKVIIKISLLHVHLRPEE